jgi:hypothetical protein
LFSRWNRLTSSACADERVHFGHEVLVRRQQIPLVGAEVPQLDQERLGRQALEHAFRAADHAGVERRRGELQRRHLRAVVGRIEPDERRLERGVQRFAPREDAQLSALGGWRRQELHLAAPDQHHAGDALVGLHREQGALVEGNREVFGRDLEILRGERFRGVEAQAVQAVYGADALERDDPPRREIAVGRAADVHSGGEDAGAAGRGDEELDDQAEAVAGRRALERRPFTLADDGLYGTGDEEVDFVAADAGFGGARVEQPGELLAFAAHQHLLEAPEQRGHRIGVRTFLCAGRRSSASQAENEEEKSTHQSPATPTPRRSLARLPLAGAAASAGR